LEFAQNISQNRISIPPKPSNDAIGLYWPEQYYMKDNPTNPGNKADDTSRRAAIVYYILKMLGYQVRIIRSDDLFSIPIKVLVIPCYFENSASLQPVMKWVNQGGKLIFSGPSSSFWEIPDFSNFVGVIPGNETNVLPSNMTLNDVNFSFTKFQSRVTYQITTAKVFAYDQVHIAAVMINYYGTGKVIMSAAAVEDTITQLFGEERDSFMKYYQFLLLQLE